MFWVDYMKYITEAVEKFRICQSQQKMNSTVQKYISEVPPHPWLRFGLFHENGFLSCRLLQQVSTHEKDPQFYIQCSCHAVTIKFSEFGRPYIFRSDNGSCRIQILHGELKNRTQSQLTPLSTEQLVGRILFLWEVKCINK